MNSVRHGWAFKLSPHHSHKVIRIVIAPLRKLNIINGLLQLRQPIVLIVLVEEHLGQRVHFRDEFPDICWASCRIDPRTKVAIEYSICAVIFSTLQR